MKYILKYTLTNIIITFSSQISFITKNASIKENINMFTKNGLGNLMQQAQKMQEKMTKIQEEIAKMEVTGEAGAGLVKVTLNGAHNCRRVEFDTSLLNDDKDMLEDLAAAAFNDAARRIAEEQKKKMSAISNGMQLPSGLNIPV